MQAVSDVVSVRCAGSSADYFGQAEPGVEEVDSLFAHATGEPDITTDLDETVVMEVGDVISQDIDVTRSAQLRVKDVVPFIVLKYNPDTDKNWTIPEPQIFSDLINRIESTIVHERLACGSAYRWANLWGRVGLLGLASRDKERMNSYRKLVEDQFCGNTRFTLFPKDALEKKGTVSVLLRAPFRDFDYRVLAQSLLNRTRQLRGALRVTHVKTYSKDDYSRSGACKHGWRLLLLQGSAEFMSSLEQFGQEYRFPLGAGHVIIRGGSDRPKGQDRIRPGNILPQSGAGRGQAYAHQKRLLAQQSAGGPGGNRSRHYSQDFPSGLLNNSKNPGGFGRGRGGPSSAWGGPSLGGRGAPR